MARVLTCRIENKRKYWMHFLWCLQNDSCDVKLSADWVSANKCMGFMTHGVNDFRMKQIACIKMHALKIELASMLTHTMPYLNLFIICFSCWWTVQFGARLVCPVDPNVRHQRSNYCRPAFQTTSLLLPILLRRGSTRSKSCRKVFKVDYNFVGAPLVAWSVCCMWSYVILSAC